MLTASRTRFLIENFTFNFLCNSTLLEGFIYSMLSILCLQVVTGGTMSPNVSGWTQRHIFHQLLNHPSHLLIPRVKNVSRVKRAHHSPFVPVLDYLKAGDLLAAGRLLKWKRKSTQVDPFLRQDGWGHTIQIARCQSSSGPRHECFLLMRSYTMN